MIEADRTRRQETLTPNFDMRRATHAPLMRQGLPFYPLVLTPIYQRRVWGGDRLVRGQGLDIEGPVGESWILADRSDAQSMVANGPLQGLSLSLLWTFYPELFGVTPETAMSQRFPLLLKLLDCQETLSVQVHPDAVQARALGGEAKAELWVFLECDSGAEVHVGLKRGVTRAQFGNALETGGGALVPLLHRIRVKKDDVLYVPPGRLHAIGAGNLLVEVQQNSDTTFRVYDWDRTGLDGKPRELHRDQSMACINFSDHEPTVLARGTQHLLSGSPFHVRRLPLTGPRPLGIPGRFAVGVVTKGVVLVGGAVIPERQCFLLPAALAGLQIVPLRENCEVLEVFMPTEFGIERPV